MHFAPELGIGRYLKSIVGDNYEAYDINPSLYSKEFNVKRFDLVNDTEKLKSNSYDLILHVHVMEHIPCNVTAVLYHLHRALKDSGRHIFSVPFMSGCYEEDLGPLTPKEKERRFGQDDHVRKFGRDDIDMSLGKVFNLPPHDLLKVETPKNLERFSIPKVAWQGYTSHSYFVLQKDDLKLC
ncbi:MAG: methyltransferase domain-containing protein [Shinella sp.]|uniref:class I SAM-dependent methyltransferase n=1 Tax=Shinella sp. TaxID=1870904 RepID=UPI003C728EFB